jgi:hypothetical protein
MQTLESLRQSILTECEEDHVGLWSVIRDADEFLPNGDAATVRDQILRLLHELLEAGEIRAGYPTPRGGFRTLRGSPDKIMARVEAAWPRGRRPTIGEGPWFTSARKQT